MDSKSRPLKILIARLTPEKTVSLSFSHKFIFELVKSLFKDKISADFFFFPERKKFAELKNNKFQGAVSKNLGIPLPEFDIIAVSNSFQLELINLFHLLAMAKAPFRSKDRLADENCPLIIAGGINTPSLACVTGSIDLAPALIDDGSSSLIDAVFMGEAERNLPDFIQAVLDDKNWKRSKYELLDKASSSIAGVYFPSKYIHEFEYRGPKGEIALKKISQASGSVEFKPARAAYVENLDDAFEFSGVIFDDSDSGATVPVEITRGCASMCSFCKEGYTQKPYREKSAPAAVSLCRRLSAETGISRFNLYSYNFNDHSRVHDIVEGIAGASLEAEVKSQRVDTALKMPKLLSYLQSSGSASPTFAVEGISARMRSYLSKNLDDRTVNKFIDGAFAGKPRQVKLFFIVTGLENDVDIAEFNEFCARLISAGKAHSPGTAVIFSFMPLVLCQKTPLIFAPAPDTGRIYKIIEKLSKSLSGSDRITARSSIGPKLYDMTAISEYGGREITRALYDLAVNAGFAYYEEIDDRTFDRFIENIKRSGFSFSEFHAEKGPDAVFNSDDREYGVSKKFLYKAWLGAKNFKDMPRCLRNSTEKCCGCGACAGDTAVYKNIDIAARDNEFAARPAAPENRIKAVVTVNISGGSELPHLKISRLVDNAPFKIIGDSLSKLSADRDKFTGKNFYLIETSSSAAAAVKIIKNARYRSLDFMLECNYLFVRIVSGRRFLKGDNLEKNALALFNELNPKFKASVFKSVRNLFGSNGEAAEKFDFTVCMNGDGLKKRPAMPLIVTDNIQKKLYCLLKNDKQLFSMIDEAEVIDFVKFHDYDVKNASTVCGACGRVMSEAFSAACCEGSSADSGRCFICAVSGR